jgi:hypothetical protein
MKHLTDLTIELLNDVADLMDIVPNNRFDFKVFAGRDWQGKSDLSCGTTACACVGNNFT